MYNNIPNSEPFDYTTQQMKCDKNKLTVRAMLCSEKLNIGRLPHQKFETLGW